MDLTSDATSSGVFLGQDRRLRLTWRILLAWLGFFGCVLIIGGPLQTATARLPTLISHAAAGLGITISALCLVMLLRRHADRRPWSGIGLTLDRATIPRLLLGLVLAAIVTTVAAAATVQLGLADWDPSANITNELVEQGLASTIIMIAISTLLVQAFPEELVFRGYMFTNLGETLPLWTTVASSSLIFGSMHVLSNSEATTLGERVLFAVAATGLGLMLAACRTVSGTLWLGIGFHGGYNAFNGRFITVHQDAFIPAWLIVLGILIAGTALTITVRQWRAPLDWRAAPRDAAHR
ncbi:MAG TPA: type II CAAX endopeptidase family protein [Pseudonocardiaceae bacterium]|nr:type II CAAX endopeptidase family protein [Pseudonocardiaceae bacterium]